MKCKICCQDIPLARIEASPLVLTCSRACADENRRQIRVAWKRESRRKTRAAKNKAE